MYHDITCEKCGYKDIITEAPRGKCPCCGEKIDKLNITIWHTGSNT